MRDLREESSEYILPDSDTDYITEDELNDLDDEELRYATNEIYARHGYIFEDKELNKYLWINHGMSLQY